MFISPLKVWVQNILPIVYDDSLSYLEIVAKINAKTNEIISQTNENTHAIETLESVISELGDIDELRDLLDEVRTIVDDLYTTDAPLMDGTASAGLADHAARSDHVHPSDTSKANSNLDINISAINDYVQVGSIDNAGKPLSFKSGKNPTNNINYKIKNWNADTNGIVLFMGNSYAQNVDGITHWPEVCAEKLGLNSNQYYNLGVSGASFTQNTYLPKLTEWVTNNPDKLDNVGAVVLVGGFNDSQGSAIYNILSGLSALISYGKSQLPNAIFYCGYSGWVDESIAPLDPRTAGYRMYAYQYFVQSTTYGWNYIDGCETIIHRKSYMQSDGIHPNQNGANALGLAVANYLKDNNIVNVYNTSAQITKIQETDPYTLEGGRIDELIDGKDIIENLEDFRVTFTDTFTLNVGNYYQMFSCNLDLVNAVDFGVIPVSFYVSSLNKYIAGLVRIYVASGKLTLYLTYLTEGSSITPASILQLFGKSFVKTFNT